MSHTDMALINTKCEDNIELRKLVTEAIRNYEEGQNENAQAAGASVKRKFEPEEAENVFVARISNENAQAAGVSVKRKFEPEEAENVFVARLSPLKKIS